MKKIEEIEQLREAVIKKHFRHYYFDPTNPGALLPGHNCLYRGSYAEIQGQERAIDDKVLYYIKLGITAKDIEAELKKISKKQHKK